MPKKKRLLYVNCSRDKRHVSLETYLVLHVYLNSRPQDVQIVIERTETKSIKNKSNSERSLLLIEFDFDRLLPTNVVELNRRNTNSNKSFVDQSEVGNNYNEVDRETSEAADEEDSYLIDSCQWPLLVIQYGDGRCLQAVAGLCAIARHLIAAAATTSNGNQTPSASLLLGFRGNCLTCPSEQSTWTRFCEIDILRTTRQLLSVETTIATKQGGAVPHSKATSIADDDDVIPIDLQRFEHHLAQPLRLHNRYKRIKQLNDGGVKAVVKSGHDQNGAVKDDHNENGTVKDAHDDKNEDGRPYATDRYPTVADLLLFGCYDLIFCHTQDGASLKAALDRTRRWYARVTATTSWKTPFQPRADCYRLRTMRFDAAVPRCSLEDNNTDKNGTGDGEKPKSYTRDVDLRPLLDRVVTLVDVENPRAYPPRMTSSSTCASVDDWLLADENYAAAANASLAALPPHRSPRKRNQLASMARAVFAIVSTRSQATTIVDFCSGAGHLGIVLAQLLPRARVLLVENKEQSCQMALRTIEKLKLNNCTVVQGNMDCLRERRRRHFDVGVALHACGVASDMVMAKCIQNGADFVCSPCCYGKVKGRKRGDVENAALAPNTMIGDYEEGGGGGGDLAYPRSNKFGQLARITYDEYVRFAHGADQTHDAANVKTAQGYRCMDVVDSDRRYYAEERGYNVYLGKLQPEHCTPKNNLLVGVCKT